MDVWSEHTRWWLGIKDSFYSSEHIYIYTATIIYAEVLGDRCLNAGCIPTSDCDYQLLVLMGIKHQLRLYLIRPFCKLKQTFFWCQPHVKCFHLCIMSQCCLCKRVIPRAHMYIFILEKTYTNYGSHYCIQVTKLIQNVDPIHENMEELVVGSVLPGKGRIVSGALSVKYTILLNSSERLQGFVI